MTEHRFQGAIASADEAGARRPRGRGRTLAIGRLAKATALLAGALITISTLQSAPASAAAARRVVPIAGTGHFLVYGTYTPTVGMTTVRLYSRDDRGRTRSLGSVQSSTPSRIPATAAGTTLVAAKDATANYRWDLTTGARTTIGPQTVAAPNGYATVGTDGATGPDARQAVLLVTPTGTTNIGVPFPKGENADGAFHLSSGSAGVTITDGNGHIRFIAFASPGTVRSLHTINRGASVPVLNCSSFTSTSVACLAFDEETTTLLGLRLSGSRVITTTPRCVGTPAALHTGIAWTGCNHRLTVLDSSGAARTSKTTFGTATPVSAYGKVVLQSKSGTTLQTMTSVSSKPRTITPAG